VKPRGGGRKAPANRPNLRALSPSGLEDLAVAMGEPKFRGRQLFRWLWARGAPSFAEMTDLPRAFRERLAAEATLSTPEVATLREAKDGTLKALLTLPTGRQVETVLIPDFDEDGDARRLTVCVSSQVGCAMACSFCATGTMGFRQNLDAGEIAAQVLLMERLSQERYGRGVSNVVFMGMGEPLQNVSAVLGSIEIMTHADGLGLSPRRITVSTVGLARRIRELADRGVRFGLAVSLHAPFDAKRSSIMPVNRSEATDLTALKDAIRYFTQRTKQRVTYEYCMFEGFNDSVEDARALAKIAAWAPSKVNLILYNPVEGLGFRRSDEETLNRFVRVLVERGVTVTVRRSRGQDIDAACGQLAVKAEG
jgi:23S rRNA (adenine2503-C2)-methyltransferase